MVVGYTPSKNAKNIKKHGISLARAADFSADLVDIDDSQDYGEIRYNAIGWIDAGLYTLTFTVRGGVTHAISLRKATKPERTYYAESF